MRQQNSNGFRLISHIWVKWIVKSHTQLVELDPPRHWHVVALCCCRRCSRALHNSHVQSASAAAPLLNGGRAPFYANSTEPFIHFPLLPFSSLYNKLINSWLDVFLGRARCCIVATEAVEHETHFPELKGLRLSGDRRRK